MTRGRVETHTYLGSSISGTAGGFFWPRWQWQGVAGLIALLLVFGLIFVCRLPSSPDLASAMSGENSTSPAE